MARTAIASWEEESMATKYCQDLKSFEEYINSNYLLNVDVLDDSFSKIKKELFQIMEGEPSELATNFKYTSDNKYNETRAQI